MNTSESSAPPPTGPSNRKELGSSSSRSDSRLSSSFGSSRSHSSSSRKQARPANQPPQPQSTESTPIFNGVDASRRNYQSTDGPSTSQPGQNKDAPDNAGPSNGAAGTAPNQETNPADSPAELRQSWYSRLADRYGSLELENKGSVARDHLALERTFLAWMRTSLAFASIGIAVTQLFRLNTATTTTHESQVHSSSAILPPHLFSEYNSRPAFTDASSNSSRLRSVGKPLGTTFIAVAILILIIGFHRYFESQYWIIRGKFPASRGSVAITALVAAALIVAALAVILAVSPGAIER
ncbi:hypothetical protein NUU61_006385 [Penicillium alfredii]|uniref:DUF202 domain-containing protein n=1 Tax=Penicillium alfredii TaxID=1506179 RepID=A0A9W9K3K7_9EURO|nr:uncharacterized protein NUU61_006385 [Penicillium alfredii]KAJ5091515.1 hypothetical protein NUU61_006385 [Penicillium alfredii]